MDLRSLLKINSQKFVFCLRCHFTQLKLRVYINYRELLKHKKAKAKVRKREGGSTNLWRRAFTSSCFAVASSHFRFLTFAFATSLSRIYNVCPIKTKVRWSRWPNRNTMHMHIIYWGLQQEKNDKFTTFKSTMHLLTHKYPSPHTTHQEWHFIEVRQIKRRSWQLTTMTTR